MSFKEFLEKETSQMSQPVNESPIKFEALNAMKEIQNALSALSFLEVMQVMRPDNPLKKNVVDLEKRLHDLTQDVGQFVNDNMEDSEEITDQ